MKKIILAILLTLSSTALFAQNTARRSESKSESTWEENKNGQIYKMKASAYQIESKGNTKPHISFSIKGEIASLSKIALARKDELYVAVPVSKESQDIKVEPGTYKFKFYHDQLGVQEFDVDLKNGDDTVVVLTLK